MPSTQPSGRLRVPDAGAGAAADAGRRPHVCFVAPEAWPVFSGNQGIEVVGGAEVQQSILARLLARAGYRVSMICLDYGQPPRTVIDGVTVLRCHAPEAGMPLLRFFHPRLTGFWNAMREADADVYYQRSAAMLTGLVAAFCRWHGKRSIYAGASDSDFQPGRQFIRYRRDRWLFERGLANVDVVVVQNETQSRDCRAHYGRPSIVIPSCYELPASARPQAGDDVLWVGTVRADKRPELFVELARRLPHRHFVMIGGAAIGDADAAAYFDVIRAAAQATPNLEFAGFLPLSKAEARFDRAGIVVNTSSVEGMPNVFLQAWARGVPTVAFVDTGARLAGQPVSCVVADTAAAAREIERMFEDRLHRGRAAARCREYFAATHGRDEVLARYGRLLEDVVRPPASSPEYA